MEIFDQMLSRYEIKTQDDLLNAQHEVMQQITLAGLYRGGFFNKAAFYGGTCLRIFYDIPRFSEDLDFSLLQSDQNFNLTSYFDIIKKEFLACGKEVEITRKQKQRKTNVESAFLKDNTEIVDLKFRTAAAIKIKLEVDINPPLGFKTESKLLLQPFSFMCRCYTLPDLYAGKMHALIFRTWSNRVKGRDWYDFEWYVRNNIPLNFSHFCERVIQFQSLKDIELTRSDFQRILKDKIQSVNIEMVKNDVRPFVKNYGDLEIWSTDYFLRLAEMISFH